MKRLLVCLLVLAGSRFPGAFACGPYYPYGDDIRFSLLKPGVFHYPGFAEFNYSAGLFYSANFGKETDQIRDTTDTAELPNISLWRKRCKNIPATADVHSAIYLPGADFANPSSANSFIRYLHKINDTAAIKYLVFARQCSPFNTIIDDPWERQEHAKVPQRARLISQALARAKATSDADLRSRYAFLAIRLAWYNEDMESVRKIYGEFCSSGKPGNIIGYWSMYFAAKAAPDTVKRNFYAAQVFSSAPDKRCEIFFNYNKEIPVGQTLKLAGNNRERAAVLMMAGFRKTGKTLDILRKFYALQPGSPGLSFLLLREVNKLEDWIYTPYYTCFNPSQEPWREDVKTYPESRIAADRNYARELLHFTDSVNLSSVENPKLWKLARGYLMLMSEDYGGALSQFNLLGNTSRKDKKLLTEIDLLKSLCLTARQKEKAVIPEEAKRMLMSAPAVSDHKFLFAIARELEFKGNSTDAALLLFKLKSRALEEDYIDEGGAYWRNGIYWKSASMSYTLYVDYYDDCFYYLDAQYTTGQLHSLVADMQAANGTDAFSKWKYAGVKKEIPRLYDLLGTKYIRKNELNKALAEFQKVSDTLWTSNHYHFAQYLDANPFYANMFSEHGKTKGDTVRFTKTGITRTLIGYLQKAENPANKERAYYYFLAANCYLNMTQYGNSWMMRRYFWTANIHPSQLEDDDEYFHCNLARTYYLKAGEASRNKKFAALCLRMAGRCEDYRINNVSIGYEPQKPLAENKYYTDLKKGYPDFYEELVSNCESIDRYFKSRN